jgi:hypothetical protein
LKANAGATTAGREVVIGALQMSSQQAIRKTVAAITAKITCLVRFCCFDTSDKFSGNGGSAPKITGAGQTWRSATYVRREERSRQLVTFAASRCREATRTELFEEKKAGW